MKKQGAKNELVRFAQKIKEYNALLAEAEALERSAIRYEGREGDDSEFISVAYRRAASIRQRSADQLIDDVAEQL